ncbi:beta subunit of fatty acid synthetase, partial [Linderina pennispora]
MRYFQGIYQSHGSRGSQLVVVPFNQGSRQDIESLVSYIFGDASKGRCLGWDLDYVLPFAAIPEMGCEITDLGSQSELAHRAMLTNVFRLLGEIKQHKSRLGYDMHPTLAVLPLSPNHGAFGGDGLYGESKIGLETLFGRWHSESWSSFITLSGAVIGWTRGTGLMGANNIIAECVERVGARTFSTEEMAFNILGLMHPRMYALAALSPVWADMAGNFQYYPSLIGSTATLRHALRDVDTIQRAVAVDSSLDYTSIAGSESERVYGLFVAQKRANHRFAFPEV